MTDDEILLDRLSRECPLVKVALQSGIMGGSKVRYVIRGLRSGEVSIEIYGATLKGAAAKFREDYTRMEARGMLKAKAEGA